MRRGGRPRRESVCSLKPGLRAAVVEHRLVRPPPQAGVGPGHESLVRGGLGPPELHRQMPPDAAAAAGSATRARGRLSAAEPKRRETGPLCTFVIEKKTVLQRSGRRQITRTTFYRYSKEIS